MKELQQARSTYFVGKT